MGTASRSFRRFFKRTDAGRPLGVAAGAGVTEPDALPVDISPHDPIIAYFQNAPGAVDIETLELDSAARDALRDAGVKIVVPLISQGELIGLLNLGPRLSEQEYSADDRKLLDTLAGQAAPAVRVAQLVRQQESQARERERLDQELRVAQLIQQQFLPRELPDIPSWRVAAYYRPAREVGGDFYDFIELPDGKIGIVVGDVTDKGVPAALVMATTHSFLRAEAPRLLAPSKVLQRVNDLLSPDMPPKMFVTCLYAVLDPATGTIQYANAGHNLPYVSTEAGINELRARGMPLGLMPAMTYEQKEATIKPGESILLHSDGLAEAHNPAKEMFGFPKLVKIMENSSSDQKLIDQLLTELDAFTGPEWEQEDDITLVTLQRSAAATFGNAAHNESALIIEFDLPSEPGNERIAMDRVAEAVSALGLEDQRLERLKTAVSEAAMNAIEHGNESRPELSISIRVTAADDALSVKITDRGGGRTIPEPELPNLEAKLAGDQNPRGWGLFLIENMVDEMNVESDATHHTLELIFHLKGDDNGG